jgi:hypothetical protein
LNLSDPKADESFKVVDRRLFSETGEFRRDVADQQEREREREKVTSAAPPPAQNLQGPANGKNQPLTGEISSGAEKNLGAAQVTAQNDPPANRGFQMLVDFVARNAAMLLGGYQDPRTGQPLLDLDGAREIIDMLDSLRETTRGNLGAEDDRLLLDVIGSLKLSFMELSKAAAAAAMKEKAKAPR